MSLENPRSADDSIIDLAREVDFLLGGLRISPSTREVERDGQRETLEPRVMQVLVALYRADGGVISRDTLIARCWEGRIVGEDAINRAIWRLRKLAEADDNVSFTIETIPRVGYRLIASQPLAATEAGSDLPAVEPRNKSVTLLVIGAAALVVVAAAGAVLWLYPKPASSPAQAVASSIEVLPFDSLDEKAAASGFGKALSEQIITTLNDVQVPTVSRESIASISGADRDATALNNGADFILSGSVQNGDNGLRVTVHLDHASTHATVWTESYDQASAEPVEFQVQIAASASDVVQRVLNSREEDPAELNDAALSIFLKLEEGNRVQTEQPLLQQMGLARRLIAQAPNFSRGYSELAITSAELINFALPADTARLRAEAKNMAARSLALNPNGWEPYLALALLVPSGQWAEREIAFRKGLAVAPNSNSLQNFLSSTLADVGRLNEALVLRRSSLTADPLSPVKSYRLAQALADTGHVSEGLAEMERSAKIWPSHPEGWFLRFDVMANFGEIADAQAMLEMRQYIPVSLEPAAIMAMHTFLNALQRKTPAARLAAGNSICAAMTGGEIPASRAMSMFSALGDTDSAFALAKTLYARQGSKPTSSVTSPLFEAATDNMRRDTRFMPLAAQAGLVDYWKTTGKWPDFCGKSGLPYDCRAEAAKVALANQN